MKVHLQQIPLEGLLLEGEENRDIYELHDEMVQPVGPLHYSLTVGLSEDGLFATGSVAQDFEMECASCLRRFVYPLDMPDFAMQMELAGSEMVDLTPQVREDIVLALPLHPRCDWDGATKCPGFPQKAMDQVEPTEPAASPTWDALDQLKLKPTK